MELWKITKPFVALVVGGLALCGMDRSARLQAATVTLPCTTNMTGYCSKGLILCTAYFMSDPNAAPPALQPPYLQIGTQPGMITNRIFLSFAPSDLLRNTNITGVQLQFNVLNVSNWPAGYQLRFKEFHSSGTDCSAIWADTADGTDYGALNLQRQQGVVSPPVDLAGAIGDVSSAMNAGREFRLGIVPDTRVFALISGYYSASPPVLTVTYSCIPAAPTGVTASDGVCGGISVNWNTVPGATSYQVLRDGVSAGTTNAPPFLDVRSEGSPHSYTVQAVNGCGPGAASAADSGYAGVAPTAPSSVAASDGTYCDRVRVSWTAGGGASSYRVTRDGQLVGSPSGSPYDDSPGDTATHTYAVSAVNSCGSAPGANTNTGYVGSAPATPAALSASHGTSATCVTLNWSAAARATTYQVWRGPTTNSGAATMLNGNVSGTTYNDCAEPLFTTNYYWVKAANNCGVSDLSPRDYGWTSAVPAPPGNVTATYGTSPVQIDVSWSQVTGASAYVLYRSGSNNVGTAAKLISTTGTGYSDFGVSNCVPYWYWVIATNMSGGSGYSSPDVGLAGSPPDGPAGVTASDGTYAGKISVIWSGASGATGYEVWRSTTNSFALATRVAGVSTTSYDDLSVSACASYWYWIKATNDCASSKSYRSDSGYAGPTAPLSVGASHGTYANHVSVSWTPVAGVTNYEVWRSSVNNTATASRINADVSAITYNDTAVSLFVTNYYWVKARGSCGVSGFSSGDAGWASAVPAAPGGVVATYGDYSDHIAVSWAAVHGADAYLLYRNTVSNYSGASIIGAAAGTNYYSDAAAVSCTPYWYWVAATNITGVSGVTNGAPGLAGSVLAPPAGLTSSHGSFADRVEVLWTSVPGAAGYAVWRALSSDLANPSLVVPYTAALSFEDSTVIACTHYSYWVTTTNDCAYSVPSRVADGYAAAGPATPTNVTASAGNHAFFVQVCWDSVPGATGYEVWTNTLDDSATAAVLSGTTNSYYGDYMILSATTNFYWVRATNSCGVSGLSSSVSGYRGVPVQVSVQMVPAGLAIFVDDTNRITAGQTFYWESNSCHKLGAPSPQPSTAGTQYRWSSWSQGGDSTNMVCASSNTTCTAVFTTQYYLTMSVGPGGMVSPVSGWYDTGSRVSLAATPASGFAFSGWTGSGPGAYTGSNNPVTVLLTNGPLSETALFVSTNPCNYALAPSGTNVSAAIFFGGFAVTADAGCSWSAVPSASWIHSDSTGTGNGTVFYAIDANPTASPRTGTITVGGRMFTIGQIAGCNYTITPSGNSIGAGAFSGVFAVVAGSGCAWSAVAGATWIHTSSSGSDSGPVAYTADANLGSAPRFGTITVQGQIFTIYQAATVVFVKSAFSGLFYETANPTEQSSGLLTVSTTSKGAFTGKVSVDGGSYAFRGRFDTTGQTNVFVPRRGKTRLNLHLQLGGQDVLTGTIDGGDWLAQLHADRAVFSSANRCGFAGLYTFRITGDANPEALPGGDSYGTFKIDSNGKVTLVGSLADNTKVTQSTGIAQDGGVPLFVPLYRGTGLMMGWLQFTTDGTGSLSGQPMWFKPPAAKGYYLGGFHQAVALSGMKYTAPASRQPVFDFTSGSVLLGGGDLPGPLAVPIQIGANNKVVPSPDLKLRLTLNAAAGKFSGSFTPASPGRAYSFQGVLVRQWNGGFGYFLGRDQSGYVRIEGQ